MGKREIRGYFQTLSIFYIILYLLFSYYDDGK